MELHARKNRGNNSTYTEGKCEGERIGLLFALREIDEIIHSANTSGQTDAEIGNRKTQ